MLNLILTMMIAAVPHPVSATSIEVPVALMKSKVAAKSVAACGFKRVHPKFDRTLQEDVVEVVGIILASQEQLHCVARASLNSGYYIVFPVSVDQEYQTLYSRMSQEQGKVDARAWLAKRGLLSGLPVHDPKSSKEVFILELETLCGPKAAGTLLPMGAGATFAAGALGTFESGGVSEGKLDDETLRCLTAAATASDYSLGFIGNEAYRK